MFIIDIQKGEVGLDDSLFNIGETISQTTPDKLHVERITLQVRYTKPPEETFRNSFFIIYDFHDIGGFADLLRDGRNEKKLELNDDGYYYIGAVLVEENRQEKFKFRAFWSKTPIDPCKIFKERKLKLLWINNDTPEPSQNPILPEPESPADPINA